MDYHPFTYLIFFDLYSFIYESLFVLLSRAYGSGWVGVGVCVCVCRRITERKEEEQLTKKEGRGSNTILI